MSFMSRAFGWLRGTTAPAPSMQYNAVNIGTRTTSIRSRTSDADAAAARFRAPLAGLSQDLIRNNPLAFRAQEVLTGNLIGAGIIPSPIGGTERQRRDLLALVEQHLDTARIDSRGQLNLYGLQSLAMRTLIADGEVIIRRRRNVEANGKRLPLPLQLEILDGAFLDNSRDQDTVPGGGYILEGIQYDSESRRVGYWLFTRHPGAVQQRGTLQSYFVPAADVVHFYRPTRPNQNRGVSWFDKVIPRLADLSDYQDLQIRRQQIAGAFAGFLHLPGDHPAPGDAEAEMLSEISPGRIQYLAPGEQIEFANPPTVSDYEPFTRGILREIAAGMGITYESVSADFSKVNFSSARMARMEMHLVVAALQENWIIPMFLQRIADWILDDFRLIRGQKPNDLGLKWTAPKPIMVDPLKEITAYADGVKAGFFSRSEVSRMLGYDPERVVEEAERDLKDAQSRGLVFSTDPIPAPTPATSSAPETDDDEGEDDPEKDPVNE